MVFLGVCAALLVSLALYSRFEAARIEARFPPVGRFESVDGVRLHFVDVPAGSGAQARDGLPVLFIHGASGNLNDPMAAFRAALEGKRRMIFVDRPGHGYSERGRGDAAAPARQAALLAGLLDRLGIARAIVVGHSWGGSVAAAMAVERADKVAGLVFVAPATHPWPGGVTWYYSVATTPVLGAAFARTLALPIGKQLVAGALEEVFAPNAEPAGYLERAAIPLALRPDEFIANAEDVAGLKPHVAAMAPRYRDVRAPTVVVTGDSDSVVLASIHAAGLVRDIPGSRLVTLPGVGHMPHHAATGTVVAAIEAVARSADTGTPLPSGEAIAAGAGAPAQVSEAGESGALGAAFH
jgi:pimeloyl-ACP methyl ester carboxylesterase